MAPYAEGQRTPPDHPSEDTFPEPQLFGVIAAGHDDARKLGDGTKSRSGSI